jgi:hypothetical protein
MERHTTSIDPQTPWTSFVVWFLASIELGPDTSIGYTGDDPSQPPTATVICTPEGSRAEITLEPCDGVHEVSQAGPRKLWHIVEQAHQRWCALGRPGWDQFRIRVTPHTQTIWVDQPNNKKVVVSHHGPLTDQADRVSATHR